MSEDEIQFLTDDEAIAFLNAPDKLAEWDDLYQRCPWSTEYQSTAFATTWYDVYSSRYKPVLAILPNRDGHLDGLMAMARSVSSNKLVMMGDGQAEYHGWLSTPDANDAFVPSAILKISNHLNAPLVIRDVLQSVPTSALSQFTNRILTKTEVRPLLNVEDKDRIEKVLRKKSNRSRLNRLNKLGEFEFKELETPKAFEACFDEIAQIFDARQKIHNGITVFDDELNRRWPVEYIKRHPGLARVFVLQLDGKVIAGLVGHKCGETLAIDVISFDLQYENHSPAKFLIYMAAQQLNENEFRFIDMTPGDQWKRRFETETEQVTTFTIHKSKISAFVDRAKRQSKSVAKQLLQKTGLKP